MPAPLIPGWMPPTRENWELILTVWQWGYPVIGNFQWAISWYGMGKTSVISRFNLPGRIGWMTMECPGFLTLLYIMNTLPRQVGIEDLPWQNKVLAGLFVIHYSYRAVAFPLMQPSMSPLHVLVWALALGFQVLNATSLASWLAAYGPTTQAEWAATGPFALARFVAGIAIFYLGLGANFFHDEELREIRRTEQRRQEKKAKEIQDQARKEGREVPRQPSVEKIYRIPQAGLFKYMLYPHYFCEWIEWGGFWMACGWGCAPARAFLLNEFFTMLPRAVRGKWWYVERFGEDKVGKKWAILPGIY